MGYRPRKCSRTNALERQGPRRWPKAWATDRCQFTGSRRDSDEEGTCSKSHRGFVAKLGLEPRP